MDNNLIHNEEISITSFGIMPDGEEVLQYTLKNKNGLKVSVINYGGIITNLFVPDGSGNLGDIVLGYDKLADYLEDSPFFGAVIGRYGNRIAGGQFSVDGKEYKLALNDNPGGIPCHLHGGNKGFDKVIWDIEAIMEGGTPGIKLSYLSEDGEEGYPGNLHITIYYYLTFDDSLRIEYYAETDQATPINLTQHSYFNLKGEGNGDILDHQLYINADNYTPVKEDLIPIGIVEPVNDTPFDFRRIKMIGQDINRNNPQLAFGGGYDHNFVLNDYNSDLCKAAVVFEKETGRNLEVWTTEPGVQFYSGNGLRENYIGKNGHRYGKQSAFCLETQHYPDSPNQSNFPSTILKPGEKYESVTEFRFRIK